MEFEKNTPASDDERRLAEAPKVMINPIHEQIIPEELPDAVDKGQASPVPQANVINDTEHTDSTQLVQPSRGVLEPELHNESNKHFLAAFFFSYLWGTFGVDRFYLGKVGTGLLKLITFGGLGFWTLIDLALIMAGVTRDKQQRPLAGYATYKKLAAHTVLYSTLIIAIVILVNGVLLIVTIQPLLQQYMSGGQLNVPGMNLPAPNQLPGSSINSL